MKNIPKKIYLQIPFDDYGKDQNFKKVLLEEEVTWCTDKINKTDVKYVLAPVKRNR